MQHLPDSHLWTLLEQKEPGVKMKYKELSANTVIFIICRRIPMNNKQVSSEITDTFKKFNTLLSPFSVKRHKLTHCDDGTAVNERVRATKVMFQEFIKRVWGERDGCRE